MSLGRYAPRKISGRPYEVENVGEEGFPLAYDGTPD
jgi:hypothetical protein